jgi:hypothetical protein
MAAKRRGVDKTAIRYSGLLAGPLDLAGQVSVQIQAAQALCPDAREDASAGGRGPVR